MKNCHFKSKISERVKKRIYGLLDLKQKYKVGWPAVSTFCLIIPSWMQTDRMYKTWMQYLFYKTLRLWFLQYIQNKISSLILHSIRQFSYYYMRTGFYQKRAGDICKLNICQNSYQQTNVNFSPSIVQFSHLPENQKRFNDF